MVPFGVPIIIRGLTWGTQKGTIILTIPHILETSETMGWCVLMMRGHGIMVVRVAHAVAGF